MLGRQRDVLTGPVLDSTVNVFELICGHIPEAHFAATLKRSFALTDKNGAPLYWDAAVFALAYTKLEEEGAFRAPEPDESAAAARPCRETPPCDEEGLRAIWLPGVGAEVVAPCQGCRPAAFDHYMREWHRKHPGPAVEPLAQVVRMAEAVKALKCSACGWSYSVVRRRAGEKCGRMLNAHVSEGETLRSSEPELCAGELVKAEA